MVHFSLELAVVVGRLDFWCMECDTDSKVHGAFHALRPEDLQRGSSYPVGVVAGYSLNYNLCRIGVMKSKSQRSVL